MNALGHRTIWGGGGGLLPGPTASIITATTATTTTAMISKTNTTTTATTLLSTPLLQLPPPRPSKPILQPPPPTRRRRRHHLHHHQQQIHYDHHHKVKCRLAWAITLLYFLRSSTACTSSSVVIFRATTKDSQKCSLVVFLHFSFHKYFHLSQHVHFPLLITWLKRNTASFRCLK